MRDLRSNTVPENPLDQCYYDDDRPEHALFANLDSTKAKAKRDSSSTTINDDFPPKVNLARANQSEFWVSMESFFDLSFWMAEQIEDLVANHKLQHPSFNIR